MSHDSPIPRAIRATPPDPLRHDDALGSWLLSCTHGDRVALHHLYNAEAGRLRGIARRITRDNALAEDVLHDVFVRLISPSRPFDPALGTATAYLTSTTRYAALDLLRRRGRLAAESDAASLEDEARALLQVQHDEGARTLAQCLDRLEEQSRYLILLSFLEGWTHAELAERLNIPLGTAKSAIRRGLLALRGCLSR